MTISWGTWALAGLVPGLLLLVTTPAILYVLYPPEVKQTPEAPENARRELEKLGAPAHRSSTSHVHKHIAERTPVLNLLPPARAQLLPAKMPLWCLACVGHYRACAAHAGHDPGVDAMDIVPAAA